MEGLVYCLNMKKLDTEREEALKHLEQQKKQKRTQAEAGEKQKTKRHCIAESFEAGGDLSESNCVQLLGL